MNVLVTGGNGFVGKELVKELVARRLNVFRFSKSRGQDITKKYDVENALHGIDIVFHLAAVVDESVSAEKMFEVNVKGTENLVEAAAKAKVKQFIFLSTVGVMGNIKGRANEKDAFAPATNYEKSKADAERIVLSFQEALPVTVVRAALVLGANHYWCEILKAVRKGFPVIGSGENHFQTIYVKDLAEALLLVMNKEECFGETFIAAGDDTPTLNEFYAMAQKALGAKGKVKHVPVWLAKIMGRFEEIKAELFGGKPLLLPEYIERLVRERYYFTEKLKSVGWKPKYSVETALKETVDSCIMKQWNC
ncbi:MAG: NAD-dependent epimerase/dehydratase family protein [Candidatus Diapherotrites archaeon]